MQRSVPKSIWEAPLLFRMVPMQKYQLPEGMRVATLEERREFYAREFDLGKVAEWFGNQAVGTKFAIVMGRHTGVFLKEYREDADTTILLKAHKSLAEVKTQALRFLPESLYYDRNVYDAKSHKLGQELAFDLDPENITCPVHGDLAEKMRRGQGLGFCKLELDMVKQQAISLYEYLENEFSILKNVYSGRGFHIHVLDKDAYSLGEKKRREIARSVKERGFAIDAWVTIGEMRLIRLPFSLNGLVSRIVTPLLKSEVERFDPVHDERCVPKFYADGAISSS
jgi:DNA primase catalytic subunit